MASIDDATLLKMAEAEIVGEAKRAAVRHSVAGISGWQPCPKPNKIFLANTLLQTMASNRLNSKKRKGPSDCSSKKRERKLLQRSQKNERTNFIYKKPEKKHSENNSKVKNSNFSKTKVTSKINNYRSQSKDQMKLNKTKKKS